ncbi:MAG: rhomboid family intramembrane serine protease [Jatrophihabitans sp.]
MTNLGGPGQQVAAPRCYRHPDRETYISCTRCGRAICPDCMRPASVGFQCPEEVKETARTVRQPRSVFGGRLPGSSVPVTTYTLIGINVAVFVAMVASGTGFLNGQPSLLFTQFADVPGQLFVVHGSTITQEGGIAHGEWYRLVTSMFLHFGIVHLGLNMYVLYAIGPAVEVALGRIRYVALYFIAGLGGSVGSFLFAGPTSVGAGASGAIFGLFGAYYILARRMNAQTGPIVITIALNLVLSVSIPHIDIRAHLGGLIAGSAVGAVMAYAPRARRTLMQAAGSALVLVIVIVLALVRAPQVRERDRNANPPYGVRIAGAALVVGRAGLEPAVPAVCAAWPVDLVGQTAHPGGQVGDLRLQDPGGGLHGL